MIQIHRIKNYSTPISYSAKIAQIKMKPNCTTERKKKKSFFLYSYKILTRLKKKFI